MTKLKISAFTFLRNAVINGFPFEESIRSALPLVDEYIVVIGAGDDSTADRVRSIGDERIQVVQTVWNEGMLDRGFIYGQQKMIGMFQCTGDWALYLEGDEVLHEDDLPAIRANLEMYLDDPETEAFYFDYLHFYGKPDQIGIGGYRQAPRIIRNTIRAIAPGGLYFVVLDKNKRGRYPKARSSGAKMYHYGHVRKIEYMNAKISQVSKFWDGGKPALIETYGRIDTAELRAFDGSHPAVMTEWLKAHAELTFEQAPDFRLSKRNRKNRIKFWMEETFGLEISKKHFFKLD